MFIMAKLQREWPITACSRRAKLLTVWPLAEEIEEILGETSTESESSIESDLETISDCPPIGELTFEVYHEPTTEDILEAHVWDDGPALSQKLRASTWLGHYAWHFETDSLCVAFIVGDPWYVNTRDTLLDAIIEEEEQEEEQEEEEEAVDIEDEIPESERVFMRVRQLLLDAIADGAIVEEEAVDVDNELSSESKLEYLDDEDDDDSWFDEDEDVE